MKSIFLMKVVLACMWTVIWFLGCSFFVSFFFLHKWAVWNRTARKWTNRRNETQRRRKRELVKTKAERERNWVGKLTSEWIGLAAGWIPEAHLSGQSLGPSVTGIPSEPSRESQTMRRRHTTFKELQKSGHLICPPTNIPGEGILWW